MSTLKAILPLTLMMLLLFACKKDKKAELIDLKKQKEEIVEKIKQLELELGDSTGIQKVKIYKVSVNELQTSVFNHFIEVQGKIDGEENVDVQPEGAGGVVKAILVTTGQYVTKGQTLARLNDAAYREQLNALQSQYSLAKETFERQQRLWQQKIGSEIQFLSAKAGKEALEGQIASLKEQINMNSIVSPINGTVEEINIKIGQIASPQLPIPAFRIVNFKSIKVKAEIAEAYSNKVNLGDNVIISFPDLNTEIEAKISAVSRFISPVNRTFTVEVKLSPEKNKFKANMIAVLKINDYKAENSVVIPVNYIQRDLDGDFVYVAASKDNRMIAQKAPVTQGQSYNGMIEITQGLKAGDKIITTGYLELEPGKIIQF
jgi:membrane fusion protein, multidrug efflux system